MDQGSRAKEAKYVKLGLGLVGLGLLLLAVLTTTTGDSGDSIEHFLFAKYALLHPELLLDHWAKPLFTFLMMPFAQLGFAGARVFNVLCGLGSAWLAYQIAVALEMKRAWLVPVFLFSMPLFITKLFSSLTEPLFALMLALAVERYLKGKITWSLILISFLPFVRSEGLVIMVVLAIYAMVDGKLRYLPLLLVGHLVYGFAGLGHYGYFLWTLEQNPYATGANTIYGSGEWYSYIVHLFYSTGIPLDILCWVGVGYLVLSWVWPQLRQGKTRYWEQFYLVFGCFLAVLVAHTIFWWFGIFGAFGLRRVLVAILPLGAIVALFGLNFILGLLPVSWGKVQTGFMLAFLGYIVIFPFTPNRAALNISRDFEASPDMYLMDEVADWYHQSELQPKTLWNLHPYLTYAIQADPFDGRSAGRKYRNALFLVPKGDLLFWDSWFSEVDMRIPLDSVMNQENLRHIKTFSTPDRNGGTFQIQIFESR